MNPLFAMAVLATLGSPAEAPSGHGPVFGLATPTNGARAWSLDVGLMGRAGSGERGAMLRAMMTYGVTEDVQLSVSGPVVGGARLS